MEERVNEHTRQDIQKQIKPLFGAMSHSLPVSQWRVVGSHWTDKITEILYLGWRIGKDKAIAWIRSDCKVKNTTIANSIAQTLGSLSNVIKPMWTICKGVGYHETPKEYTVYDRFCLELHVG